MWKCRVVEGMDPVMDGKRYRNVQLLVNNVHKLAWSGDNFQDHERRYSARDKKQDSNGLEDRSASHKTFVGKLSVNAEDGARMLHQITRPTVWRGSASLFLEGK